MKDINIKRVYDAPAADDGFRILIDRLWPRGLAKKDAQVDLWLKAVAPSSDLRKWFGHDPDKWTEFKKRYRAELAENTDAVDEIQARMKHGKICLLYAAKDTEHNNAVALQEYLARRRG